MKSLPEQVMSYAEERPEAAPGIDIDEAADTTTFALTDRPASSVTMDDLDRVIRRRELLPDGFTVQPLGPREYSLSVKGARICDSYHHRCRLLREAR